MRDKVTENLDNKYLKELYVDAVRAKGETFKQYRESKKVKLSGVGRLASLASTVVTGSLSNSIFSFKNFASASAFALLCKEPSIIDFLLFPVLLWMLMASISYFINMCSSVGNTYTSSLTRYRKVRDVWLNAPVSNSNQFFLERWRVLFVSNSEYYLASLVLMSLYFFETGMNSSIGVKFFCSMAYMHVFSYALMTFVVSYVGSVTGKGKVYKVEDDLYKR